MLTGPRKPVVLVLIPLIVTESPPVLLKYLSRHMRNNYSEAYAI